MYHFIKISTNNAGIKKLFFTSLLLLFFFNISSQENLNDITLAFKQGNAKKMSKYFDTYIDLTFSEESNTHSKRQAELILQNFFAKVEPSNYQLKKTGKSSYNNTKFNIGVLSTSNGEYKVYTLFIFKNETFLLKEIRFEK